jgi:hypothetical protein
MEFTPSLFSTKVHFGRRTIFFDVKPTKDNKPYIKITESSISKEGEKKRSYMTIFENEMADVQKALEQVVSFARQDVK